MREMHYVVQEEFASRSLPEREKNLQNLMREYLHSILKQMEQTPIL